MLLWTLERCTVVTASILTVDKLGASAKNSHTCPLCMSKEPRHVNMTTEINKAQNTEI